MKQIVAHMNISQNKELVERVLSLAEKKATGTPRQLAGSLRISERNLYRILDCIKDAGMPITYSRTLQSYILE